MAKSARYYYNGTIKGRKYIQDNFIFAFTPFEDYKNGWMSNSCENSIAFRMLAAYADGARTVTVAMLHSHAMERFQIKQEHDQLIIYGFDSYRKGYQVGETIATVFKNVVVTNLKTISGWQGLPAPYQMQMNEINRQQLRILSVSAVTLFLGAETDVVSNS